MSFRLTRLEVKPLSHDLNNGYSLGLQYPLIYGYRPERRCWMLWNRHTGHVFAYASEHTPDWMGRHMMQQVAELQTIAAEPFNPANNDSVS